MKTRAAWRGAVAAGLAAVALQGLYLTGELRAPMSGIVIVAFFLAVVAVGYLRGNWTAIPIATVCVLAPTLVLAIDEGIRNGIDGASGDHGDLEGLDYMDGGVLDGVLLVVQVMLPISIMLPTLGLLLHAVVRRISHRSKQG